MQTNLNLLRSHKVACIHCWERKGHAEPARSQSQGVIASNLPRIKSTCEKNQPVDPSALTLPLTEILAAVIAFDLMPSDYFRLTLKAPPTKEINTDLGGRSIVIIVRLAELFGGFRRFSDRKPNNC